MPLRHIVVCPLENPAQNSHSCQSIYVAKDRCLGPNSCPRVAFLKFLHQTYEQCAKRIKECAIYIQIFGPRRGRWRSHRSWNTSDGWTPHHFTATATSTRGILSFAGHVWWPLLMSGRLLTNPTKCGKNFWFLISEENNTRRDGNAGKGTDFTPHLEWHLWRLRLLV